MKWKIWIIVGMVLLFSCTHKLRTDKTNAPMEIPNLNGTWVLVEVNNSKVTLEKSGKELPYLEFNTSINSLTGSTGCNRITGKAVVTDAVVNFENFASTRMHCMNAIYEAPMLQLLRGSLSYQLVNNRLVFTKEGKQILVFQK